MRRILLLRALRALDLQYDRYESTKTSFSPWQQCLLRQIQLLCAGPVVSVRNSADGPEVLESWRMSFPVKMLCWLPLGCWPMGCKTKPWYKLRALPWQWWFGLLLRFEKCPTVRVKTCKTYSKGWSIGMIRCTFQGLRCLALSEMSIEQYSMPSYSTQTCWYSQLPSQVTMFFLLLICFISSIYKFCLGISQHPSQHPQCPVEFLTLKLAVKVVRYAPLPHCSAMLDAFATGIRWMGLKCFRQEPSRNSKSLVPKHRFSVVLEHDPTTTQTWKLNRMRNGSP